MAATVETSKGAAGANMSVAPFYSQLEANGSASLDILTEQNVSMAYDVSYSIVLNDVSSCAILNAFKVSGSGETLAVDMRDDSEEGEEADAFKAMIKFVIDNAKDVCGNTVQTDLYNDAIETFKSVYGDKIGNLLQSNWSLAVSVHSTLGAANVWSDFATDAGARLLLAQQIPDTDYMANSDASENSLTDALPLTGGDQMVFLFNLSSTLVSRSINDAQPNTAPNVPGASVTAGPTLGGDQATGMAPDGGPVSSVGGTVATATNDAPVTTRNGNSSPAIATSNKSSAQLVAFYVTLNAWEGAGKAFTNISAELPTGQIQVSATHSASAGLGDEGTIQYNIPVQSGVDPNANV